MLIASPNVTAAVAAAEAAAAAAAASAAAAAASAVASAASAELSSTFAGGDTTEFPTRAAAIAASISPEADYIRTAGYSEAGDNGHGLYIRAASEPTHAAKFQSADGAWWQLVPEGGVIRLEQFGGKADYAGGATGTDNYQPLMDATGFIQFDPAANGAAEHCPIIQLGFGKYKVTQTVMLWVMVYIRGAVGHMPDPFGFGGASQFHFTNTSGSAFVFFGNNIGVGNSETGGTWPAGQNPGSSAGSKCEGFSVHNASGLSTRDMTQHAFHVRCTMSFDRVGVYGTRGSGFYIHAQAGAGGAEEGNANGWQVIDCYGKGVMGHYLHIDGPDANGGVSRKFTTHGVAGQGGCGILDRSTLGNTHIQPQITGYGNMGVHYEGKQYQLIVHNAGVGEATTPGTDNTKWYYLRDGGTSSSFPEWSATPAGAYLVSIPIYTFSAFTTVISPYVEGAVVISHGAGLAYGGVGGWTRYTPNQGAMTLGSVTGIVGAGPVGSYVGFANQTGAEQTANGDSTWVTVGGPAESGGYATGMNLLRHRRAIDGDNSWEWQYSGGETVYGFLNAKAIWRISTPSTTLKFGRPLTTVPHMISFQDYALRDPSNSNNWRIHGLKDAIPTATGEYARGELRWGTNLTAGEGVGWVCTTGGALANAWVTGTNYDTTSYVKASNNKFYKCTVDPGSGLSTVEPSHASGQVVEADGYGWTHVTDTQAVWVPFGNSHLDAIATVDPASLAPGQRTATATITVTGAVAGNIVKASFSVNIAPLQLVAWVSSDNTVSYYFQNPHSLLSGSATYDAPSIAAGAETTTTVTVTGAALGDVVDSLSLSVDQGGLSMTGYVSAADTVTAILKNGTAAPIDLASATLLAFVRPVTATDIGSGTLGVRVEK